MCACMLAAGSLETAKGERAGLGRERLGGRGWAAAAGGREREPRVREPAQIVHVGS